MPAYAAALMAQTLTLCLSQTHEHVHVLKMDVYAETRDRTGDLQIFSLTLSQLSYRGDCERDAQHLGP